MQCDKFSCVYEVNGEREADGGECIGDMCENYGECSSCQQLDNERVRWVEEIGLYIIYQSYNIPTEFLPKYKHNGSREMKAPTHLLEENGCSINTQKFNKILIERGFLEERTRPSSKGTEKKFKVLTEKGLKYGENTVSPHNQREVQLLYYADTFMELYNMVIE